MGSIRTAGQLWGCGEIYSEKAYTVEPLYNGQVGAGRFCPLHGGVLYREGPSILAPFGHNDY